MEKKKAFPQEGFLWGRVVNYDLESVVETNAEDIQVSTDAAIVHVGTEAELVAATSVGGCELGIAAEDVDIEVQRAVLADGVVQTRNKGEAEAGVVVAIVDSGGGSAGVVGALEVETKSQLCLSKNGEVFPVGNIVAEVGVEPDGGLAGSTGLGGGGVGVGIASIVSGVVILPAELCTNLHVFVQLVANFGHDGEAVGGGTAGIVFRMPVVVISIDVATDNQLSISGHCECCESKG